MRAILEIKQKGKKQVSKNFKSLKNARSYISKNKDGKKKFLLYAEHKGSEYSRRKT